MTQTRPNIFVQNVGGDSVSNELYAAVVGHLLTSISLAKDKEEKARLTKLCKQVMVASGLGK